MAFSPLFHRISSFGRTDKYRQHTRACAHPCSSTIKSATLIFLVAFSIFYYYQHLAMFDREKQKWRRMFFLILVCPLIVLFAWLFLFALSLHIFYVMGVARFRVVYACLQYGTRMLSLYVLVLFFFVSSVFVCLAFGSIINEVSDDTLTNIFNNILATQRHKITHTHTHPNTLCGCRKQQFMVHVSTRWTNNQRVWICDR